MMFSTSLLLQLALVVPAMLVAVLAHEVTHYLAAYPIAEDVRMLHVAPTSLAVEYDYYDQPWRHRAADVANLSPLILGLVAMAVAWATVGLPAAELGNLWMLLGWLAFTVGGPADFVRWLV
jgi:hypothetical protein